MTKSLHRTSVATDHFGYNSARNFAGLPLAKYQVTKRHHLCSITNAFTYRVLRRQWPIVQNTHIGLSPRNIRAWHFFNSVSAGPHPWVSTFETELPRWGDGVSTSCRRRGLDLLARSPCRRLIALSECGASIQRARLAAEAPDLIDEVTEKLSVLHPSQIPLIEDVGEKRAARDRLQMVLVGDQFFRKGGRECLAVARELAAEGWQFDLHIVSGLYPGDYASRTDTSDVVAARREIADMAGLVTYHGRLPNHEVLQLLRSCHIGLLPTYAETYGYAALEAAAAGCAVISTNVRALPEINSSETGWLIDVPKNDRGDGQIGSPGQRAELSKAIEVGLYAALSEALRDPRVVAEKGANALQRIRSAHDPAHAAAALEAIYDGI